MFVGHYGVSFALKRLEPRLSLGLLFLAVQALDVLFSGFVLAGVEKMRIVPGFTAYNPYDLYFMPYSHSLVGAAAWSLLALGAFLALGRRQRSAAALVAAAVFSHFLLDVPVHTPDLPLLGPGSAKVGLPALGERIAQGEPAFQIGDGEKDVPMLAPVDGTVVAVNQAVKERQDGLDDPYGRGWLFKVKAPRIAANLRQLLKDGAARRFMEEAEGRIAMQLAPELGQVLQDGGTPVHGISRALAGDKWDDLARQFFLT